MAFYGKVALVTGGASGMGRVAALRLARQGASVAIVDLNATALAETAAEAPNIRPFQCDVTDQAAVAALVQGVETELGPIDRLVHAAGIMPGQSLIDMPAEKILRVMAVNYGGTVQLTKALLPLFVARNRGDMIVFGSVTGSVPASEMGAYSASKAAVNFYMEILMNEHRTSAIRFLLACPSAVDTPLIGQAVAAGPKALAEAAKKGKMASPDSIIDAIEAAIEKGQGVLYPGEARMGSIIRRLSPKLMWALSNKMNA